MTNADDWTQIVKFMQHNTNRTASHKPTLFGSVDICMASYVTTVHTHFAWPNQLNNLITQTNWWCKQQKNDTPNF